MFLCKPLFLPHIFLLPRKKLIFFNLIFVFWGWRSLFKARKKKPKSFPYSYKIKTWFTLWAKYWFLENELQKSSELWFSPSGTSNSNCSSKYIETVMIKNWAGNFTSLLRIISYFPSYLIWDRNFLDIFQYLWTQSLLETDYKLHKTEK